MEKMHGHKAHHHRQARKDGGKAEPKPYNAVGSDVEEEAEEKARGGKVKHMGAEHHKAKKHRLDRPGRKRGGRAGAEHSPLSNASKIRDASEHKTTDSGNASGGP